MPINAPAKPAIINPIITKDADDLTRNDNEITKNKATIAPKNEAIIVIQGLLRNSSNESSKKEKSQSQRLNLPSSYSESRKVLPTDF